MSLQPLFTTGAADRLALLSPGQMAKADRLTAERGTAGPVLMERAGRAVSESALRLAGDRAVTVLCGPGNNGGDGYVAARVLAEQGREVRLVAAGGPPRSGSDAAWAAGQWSGPIENGEASWLPDSLIVDALLGAGLARDVQGEIARVIDAVNASGLPVLAVDLPSGIDGATGQVRGTAVRASATVTFFRRKPGHLLLPGRLRCGPVEVADIGIEPDVLASVGADTAVNEPALWQHAIPRLAVDGHKYSRGHAVQVSGGIESSGASRLAARAALRIGAGLVTVACPGSALLVQASALDAVMVRRCDGAEGLGALLADPRRNAVGIGPGTGVGEETVRMVLTLLGAGRSAVLDADALTSFRDTPGRLFEAIEAGGGPTVLTPHEGEFRALFPDQADASAGKLARARAAAALSEAVVVLKGPDTVVAAPDGRAAIACNAPPTLATAGSGDVLTGFVNGLMAQDMPAFEAACAAVWLHGEAGRAAGPGLIAEDLPEAVRASIGRLRDDAER